MVILIIAALGLIFFIVAIVSPKKGSKIEHKTDQNANDLKHITDWLWNPITRWTKASIEFNRKIIVKIVALGKRARKRIISSKK